jgi:SH3-like domain-containing protein
MFRVALIVALACAATTALAETGQGITRALGPSTNLPLPRFVTLKKDEVYMRRGPGPDHPIEWIYVRRHLPLEVINEYDLWREVRDADGTVGWISANMLSGERFVMVREREGKEKRWPLHRRPDEKSDVVALADPGAIAELKHCPDAWCEVASGNHTGWIDRKALWGILADERVQ